VDSERRCSFLRVAASSNPSFQGAAGKLRLPVPYGLRPSAAPELRRSTADSMRSIE
jgi:hypothetical protein